MMDKRDMLQNLCCGHRFSKAEFETYIVDLHEVGFIYNFESISKEESNSFYLVIFSLVNFDYPRCLKCFEAPLCLNLLDKKGRDEYLKIRQKLRFSKVTLPKDIYDKCQKIMEKIEFGSNIESRQVRERTKDLRNLTKEKRPRSQQRFIENDSYIYFKRIYTSTS
jgi:hypothetical protein